MKDVYKRQVQRRAARDLYEEHPEYGGDQSSYEGAGGFSFDAGDADDGRDPFAGETLDETMRRVRGEPPVQPEALFGAPDDGDLPLWDDLTDGGEQEPPEDSAFAFGAHQETPVPRGTQHRHEMCIRDRRAAARARQARARRWLRASGKRASRRRAAGRMPRTCARQYR